MPFAIRATADCDNQIYDKVTGKVMGCVDDRDDAEEMIRVMHEYEASHSEKVKSDDRLPVRRSADR